MKNKKIKSILKREISLLLAVLFAFSSFLFPSPSKAETAPSLPSSMFFTPCKTNILPGWRYLADDYSDEAFGSTDKDVNIYVRPFNGKNGIYIKPEDGFQSHVTVTKSYSAPLDLTEYTEIFFRVFAENNSYSAFEISMTLWSGTHSVTQSARIPTSSVYDVYFSVEDFGYRWSIDKIEIQIKAPKSMSALTVSALFADEMSTYSHLKLFSSDSFSVSEKAEIQNDKIAVPATEASEEIIAEVGYFLPLDNKGESVESGFITARLMISGAENGTVTFSVKKNEDNEYTDISTLTLYPGEKPYVALFNASDGCDSYKVTFSGVTAENDDKIFLHSVGLEYFPDNIFESSETFPGNITSCSITQDGAGVRINGSLRPDTVVNHINAKLGVYAVDMWDEDKSEMLAAVDMTTVFSISFKTDILKENPGFYRYYVAIVEKDEVLPVTAAAYPSVAAPSVSSGESVLGLQTNDSSATFRANASHTVVDVYLDKLEGSEESGRIYTYGNGFCYLDNSYINKLDSEINFPLQTGANVYLRIISSVPFANSEDNAAEYYSFDSKNKSNSVKYMASLDFLLSRYENISGLIVGSRVNCTLYNHLSSVASLAKYAENYVNILRLTAVVIQKSVSNAAVIVPFGDNYIYKNEALSINDISYNSVTGTGTVFSDPVLFSSIISHLIAKNGGFQWYLMYECENSPEENLYETYHMANRLVQGNGTSPKGQMLFWKPEHEITKEEILSFAGKASESKASVNMTAAIISVSAQYYNTDLLCNTLASAVFNIKNEGVVMSDHAYKADNSASAGKHVIKDFRRSYSTEGFVFGGSVYSLSTESSPELSEFESVLNCRGLYGESKSELGKTALIFCSLDTPTNFSKASYADVTLYAESENETIPVKIIFGKGTTRFEFSYILSSKEATTVRCKTDKKDYDLAVDYIAISFDSETDIAFSVSEISVASEVLGNSELRAALTSEINVISENRGNSKTLSIFLTVGLTVVVFALFSIKTEPAAKAKKKKRRGKGSAQKPSV